jgi:hypothetical protein
MKRMLIISVVAAFLLGGMAYATGTRVISMGEVNNIVKDGANIWLYPSTINYYPNIFRADISGSMGTKNGSDGLWKVGTHLQFGQDSESPWVLGAYFSTQPYSHDIISFGKTESSADQRINLFYGRNLGNTPFGFALGYYSDGDKNEDTLISNNYEESLSRYEFLFGISPMEGKADVSFGVAFTTWTDKDYDGSAAEVVDITKPSGNMDLTLRARYWMDPMGKFVTIPHVSFVYSKQGLEDYGWSGTAWERQITTTYDWMVIDFGMGLNCEADEDVLVVTDFGIAMDNFKIKYEPVGADATEYKDNYLILPYFKVGIDAYIMKWLDLRAGIISEWARNSYEPDDWRKRIYSDAYTWSYLGAGVHWGNFHLDAIIDPDFVTNGPYFISGEPSDDMYNGLASRVSLLYKFD